MVTSTQRWGRAECHRTTQLNAVKAASFTIHGFYHNVFKEEQEKKKKTNVLTDRAQKGQGGELSRGELSFRVPLHLHR